MVKRVFVLTWLAFFSDASKHSTEDDDRLSSLAQFLFTLSPVRIGNVPRWSRAHSDVARFDIPTMSDDETVAEFNVGLAEGLPDVIAEILSAEELPEFLDSCGLDHFGSVLEDHNLKDLQDLMSSDQDALLDILIDARMKTLDRRLFMNALQHRLLHEKTDAILSQPSSIVPHDTSSSVSEEPASGKSESSSVEPIKSTPTYGKATSTRSEYESSASVEPIASISTFPKTASRLSESSSSSGRTSSFSTNEKATTKLHESLASVEPIASISAIPGTSRLSESSSSSERISSFSTNEKATTKLHESLPSIDPVSSISAYPKTISTLVESSTNSRPIKSISADETAVSTLSKSSSRMVPVTSTSASYITTPLFFTGEWSFKRHIYQRHDGSGILASGHGRASLTQFSYESDDARDEENIDLRYREKAAEIHGHMSFNFCTNYIFQLSASQDYLDIFFDKQREDGSIDNELFCSFDLASAEIGRPIQSIKRISGEDGRDICNSELTLEKNTWKWRFLANSNINSFVVDSEYKRISAR